MRPTRTRMITCVLGTYVLLAIAGLAGCDKDVAAQSGRTLDRVLGAGENSDWILFFDEADALFGKRTEVQDAHDRYDDD